MTDSEPTTGARTGAIMSILERRVTALYVLATVPNVLKAWRVKLPSSLMRIITRANEHIKTLNNADSEIQSTQIASLLFATWQETGNAFTLMEDSLARLERHLARLQSDLESKVVCTVESGKPVDLEDYGGRHGLNVRCGRAVEPVVRKLAVINCLESVEGKASAMARFVAVPVALADALDVWIGMHEGQYFVPEAAANEALSLVFRAWWEFRHEGAGA